MKGTLGYKIRTITCASCGREVTGHLRPAQRFCSLECYRSSPKPERRKHDARTCAICGAVFYNPDHVACCSMECARVYMARNKTEHICKVCGKTFYWSPSRTKSGQYNVTYCSLDCRDADPERHAQLVAMNAAQQRRFQSRIERIGYALLDSLGVVYSPQHVISGKFCVDAFVSSHGLVIQFDGDYWHGHPEKFPQPDARQRKRMRLDASQDAYMTACRYRVLRFWESDLHHNPDAVTTALRSALVPR